MTCRVAMLLVVCAAITSIAAAEPVQSFTAAEIAATVSAAPAPPGAMLKPVRLNGGSDGSTFAVDLDPYDGPGHPKPFSVDLVDVPCPADLRPGDRLTGRAWISPRSGPEPSGTRPSTLALVVTDSAGDEVVCGQLPLRWRGRGSSGLQPGTLPPPFRLPVTFDPAHRPTRLRIRWTVPPIVIQLSGRGGPGFCIVGYGFRLVHGDEATPEPTTRPTGQPSPESATGGGVATTIRTLVGNDFAAAGENADDPVQWLPFAGDGRTLTVRDPPAQPLRSVPVAAVDDPGITANQFALNGTVEYGGVGSAGQVEGFGYLELVSDFAAGDPVVTRGLSGSGPMQALTGRSGPRPFALPVDAGGRRPTRVRLNLVMSGTGTVTLSDLKLVQYAQAVPAPAATVAATTRGPQERTVHMFDVSDLTEEALAVVTAASGPQKTGHRPLLPALRDVRLFPLPDGRITVMTPDPGGGPRVLPFVSRGTPEVTADDYAIVGRVRYGGADDATDMDGVGYLEMWSEFADGSRYFTRTLADDGPLQKLSGHSDGRPFRLPFHAAGPRPVRLTLDVVLPGRASVTLSDVQLVQGEPAAEAAARPTPWWAQDHSTSLAVGLFGCIGFVAFLEPLVRRGVAAYRLLVAAVVGVGLLGQAYFAWAMAVVGHGDSWRAWGPLLLCAACAWCVPACLPRLGRRYREAELRRMRAVDAVAV